MAVGAVKVEAVPGSGDIPPLDIAVVLKLTHVTLTGNHHHSRPDRTAMIVAEADTATGHIDGPVRVEHALHTTGGELELAAVDDHRMDIGKRSSLTDEGVGRHHRRMLRRRADRSAVHHKRRMYDARQFTMAEIAASCGVTPMTIYRHIRTIEPATP